MKKLVVVEQPQDEKIAEDCLRVVRELEVMGIKAHPLDVYWVWLRKSLTVGGCEWLNGIEALSGEGWLESCRELLELNDEEEKEYVG